MTLMLLNRCLWWSQYEHKTLQELLEKGHPNAAKKVRCLHAINPFGCQLSCVETQPARNTPLAVSTNRPLFKRLPLHAQIGCGLAGFQVRKFNEGGALAFYVVRTDGSAEDFSYLKCCAALFPGVSGSGSGRGRGRGRGGPKSDEGQGSGGGGRGGRGRGGRGRGGRGRGRGRR